MKQTVIYLALATVIIFIAGCAQEGIAPEEQLSEDAKEQFPAEESKLPTCAEAGGECLEPWEDRCSGIKFEAGKEVSDCPGRCCVCCKKIIPECVPDACCHASGCVLRQLGPDCKDVVCSMECREGTMDCGKGRCEFDERAEGHCRILWK